MKTMELSFLKRKKDAHKGNYGHLFILAGSEGMAGAACLCAKAALRSGTGLVTLGVPSGIQSTVSGQIIEAMTKQLSQTKDGTLSLKAFPQIRRICHEADIMAIGPGLSRNRQTQQLIRKIVSELNIPMVIDADGLNALEGNAGLLKKQKAFRLITPHPGEMSRLAGVSIDEVQKNRIKLAKQFSCRYNNVTVLKGYRTVIADFSGQTCVNTTGNPGLAKGGSGDVLTGIIAAFCCQGGTPYQAAKAAVYVHGLAADKAEEEKGQISLTASDVIETLPKIFKKLHL